MKQISDQYQKMENVVTLAEIVKSFRIAALWKPKHINESPNNINETGVHPWDNGGI